MPLVRVFVDPQVASTVRHALTPILPEAVADALTVLPDGELMGTDISVFYHEFQPGDVYTHRLEICIWANDYPERRAIVNQAAAKLRDLVEQELLKKREKISLFVWILLQPGAFAEKFIPGEGEIGSR